MLIKQIKNGERITVYVVTLVRSGIRELYITMTKIIDASVLENPSLFME